MSNPTLSNQLQGRQPLPGFFRSRRSVIVEIIGALFIFLFVYTAINKIIAFDTLKHVLKKYPLIGDFSTLVAWLLPAAELVVAAMLFIPKTKLVGLYSALSLMSAFTIYLFYMLVFTPKLPCTCGGMLQQLSWPQHLIFNLFFVLLAIVGIRLFKKQPK